MKQHLRAAEHAAAVAAKEATAAGSRMKGQVSVVIGAADFRCCQAVCNASLGSLVLIRSIELSACT